jgi:hypothetical protein
VHVFVNYILRYKDKKKGESMVFLPLSREGAPSFAFYVYARVGGWDGLE